MGIFASTEVTILFHAENHLGEGAFWDVASQRLLWVDILERQVLVQKGSEFVRYTLPVMPSVIWKVVGEQVYLATEQGVGMLDLADGSYRTVVEVEANQPRTRSNDGGVSPDGSFWFGTMLREPLTKGGGIYRVDSELSVEYIDGPVGIPNTFLFPSGRNDALIGDTYDRCIYRYALDSGGPRREGAWLVKDESSIGDPDGSALLEGIAIVNAEWDGGRLVAYDLDGAEIDEFRLPVSRPTSCAVGGADGRTLFVTSAREGLSDDALAGEPAAGSVFKVRIDSGAINRYPTALT